MDTPESIVYQGREGTGLAQVFGQPGDPLGQFQHNEAVKQRKAAEAAAAARQAKAERDKKQWNLMNVDPEKAYAPFNQQVLDAADQHRKMIGEYFEKGGDPDDPAFQRTVKAGWDAVNHKARQSNYVKDTIDETMKGIQANPYQIPEY